MLSLELNAVIYRNELDHLHHNLKIGGFAYELASVLEDFARLDPSCIQTFEKLCQADMGFGFEAELVRILDEGLDPNV